MLMIRNFLTSTVFTALLCMTTTAVAEDLVPEKPRWFQIELIFFEPLETTPTGEIWPAQKVIPESDNIEPVGQTKQTTVTELFQPLQPVVVRDNPDVTPRAFQLLNPTSFAMSDLSKRLLDSKQYRILSHIAWRQPTVGLTESRAVHVHDELMQEDAMIPVSNKPLVLNNLPDPLEQSETGIKQKRFDGTITVSLSRYLHLKTDITYYNPEVYLSEQIAEQNIDTPNIEYFKMVESRRMRSKRIHYLDHPYFGILALITPYKINDDL